MLINRTPRFQRTAASQQPLVTLSLTGALDAVGSVRDRIEAGLGNFRVAVDAGTIGTILDSFKSTFNLFQCLFFALQKAQSKLLLEVVCAHIRHVHWHTREVTAQLTAGLAKCCF